MRFSKKTRSSVDDGPRRGLLLLTSVALLVSLQPAAAQTPAAADLASHISQLSALDYQTRMNAARQIRRADATQAAGALRQAVAAPGGDEFVRYRAFVLLSSFSERATTELAATLLRDRNDRLREAAYKWLEAHPDAALTPTLLAALQTEQGEFVRPALVGALAALGRNPQVQRALITETSRGVDFFRSAVIEALGRHRAVYAVDAIAAVAAREGPLQDDAVLALGRIGGDRAKAALRTIDDGSAEVRLTMHGAQCLAGETCDPHLDALRDALVAPGVTNAVLRVTMSTLAAVAGDGNNAATAALLTAADRGGPVRDQAALALAVVAVRNPGHVIAWLDAASEPVRAKAADLLKDGFDDLDEDFGEEQFFAAVRASYWKAAEGSPSRTLAATVIQKLDF